MPLYENVFIARQDISSTQVEALADGFAAIIEAQGGKIAKRESWGLRNLSYRIRKNRKGHYMLFNIDGPPAAIAELERNMRISEDVLRYLTLRVETHEEGPSIVLQNRGRSDERDRDRDRGPRRYGDREREAPAPAPAAEGVEA